MKIDKFINKYYTAKEVQDIQCSGYKPSCDMIFGMKSTDLFEEISVKIKEIAAPSGLSLAFYKRKELDEDINIVERIINAYINYENVPPIVIDENMKIMDGLHRYVAAKEYFGPNSNISVLKKIKS